MPKRTDIHKILVIGSGPIVMRQATSREPTFSLRCFTSLLIFSVFLGVNHF